MISTTTAHTRPKRYTFFLNFMGPITNDWYEDNNIPFTEETRYSSLFDRVYTRKVWNETYCGGRIDIHHPDLPYNEEYGIDIMESRSWNKLAHWLKDLKLCYLPNKDELLSMFEKDTGHKLEYFNKEK